MKRIFKITEQQYCDIFLNEARHYPEFLDSVKNEVWIRVKSICENMLKTHKDTYYEEISNIGNPYFSSLKVYISLKHDFNLNVFDENSYNISVQTDGSLYNNKLVNCSLYVTIPVSEDYKIHPLMLRKLIFHEVTHLYDVWNDRIHGGSNILDNDNIISNKDAMKNGKLAGFPILKELGQLAYMSIDTEKKAFTSELMSELETLHCTMKNYRDVIKKTDIYVNTITVRDSLYNELENTNDEYLKTVNDICLDFYTKSSIPKMNKGDFDAKTFKTKLHKWVDALVKVTI